MNSCKRPRFYAMALAALLLAGILLWCHVNQAAKPEPTAAAGPRSVVVCGIGNLRGSVIAATVLTVLPELLSSMNDYRMLIYAIVLIVVMIFNQSPQMIAMRKRLTARFRKDAADKAPKKNKKEAA